MRREDTRDCPDPDELQALLAGALEGERPEALLRHIDACPACRMGLAPSDYRHPSAVLTAWEHPLPSRPALTLSTGERLGRYEIMRFIARGGMGEVYEAHDHVLQDRVALKTLAVTLLDDDQAFERLKAEVRLARKVTHRNVCRILEFGVHERRSPDGHVEPIAFLTMEYLEGVTLRSAIKLRSFDDEACKAIFLQICAGLGAIHEKGIIHRDLKSDNVFLVPLPDGAQKPVVMDFGLAREDGGRNSGLTSTSIVGTPHYMAPEQLQGQRLTPATDIYALGVVLFEALTGELPFSGRSSLEIAARRLNTRPPRPSSVRSTLNPAWDAIVLACLERDPRVRLKTVEELGRRLEDLACPSRSSRMWWAVPLAVAAAASLTFWVGHEGSDRPDAAGVAGFDKPGVASSAARGEQPSNQSLSPQPPKVENAAVVRPLGATSPAPEKAVAKRPHRSLRAQQPLPVGPKAPAALPAPDIEQSDRAQDPALRDLNLKNSDRLIDPF